MTSAWQRTTQNAVEQTPVTAFARQRRSRLSSSADRSETSTSSRSQLATQHESVAVANLALMQPTVHVTIVRLQVRCTSTVDVWPGRRCSAASGIDVNDIPQPLHLPLPAEAGEAGLAGQELLHGGLFEVALLGDEPIQPAQQRIHIAQRRRDGALFGVRWEPASCSSIKSRV